MQFFKKINFDDLTIIQEKVFDLFPITKLKDHSLFYLPKSILIKLPNIMKNFCTYLDIPSVPEYLIEPPKFIINKPPKPGSNISSSYIFFQTRLVSKELEIWVKDIFKRDCFVQYQIVRNGIHIHKDKGRNVAFNYLIETGGAHATTCFYDDNKTLIHSEILKPKLWHRLKTDVNHDVRNINIPRIAISVEVFDYKWDDPFLDYSVVSMID